jgi:hypothetical protein
MASKVTISKKGDTWTVTCPAGTWSTSDETSAKRKHEEWKQVEQRIAEDAIFSAGSLCGSDEEEWAQWVRL